jgi:rSAM/selenodomain-associated transferase 2
MIRPSRTRGTPPAREQPALPDAQPPLSIIVPTLNEAGRVGQTLALLQPMRRRGTEVIVVDGGSTDGTVDVARPHADQVITSEPGRAKQQNAGAAIARGRILLFLHADTHLPYGADELVTRGLSHTRKGWGRFDVLLSGRSPMLRVVERMISLRSRVSGIATGDQAIFVRADWFQMVKGFPDIPLMEDVALSRALKRLGPPHFISDPVVTSSERWEKNGTWRTIVLMWRLRWEFWRGADRRDLAARYRA